MAASNLSEAQIQSSCVIAFRNAIGRHERGLMVEVNNNPKHVVDGVKRLALGLVKGFPDTMIITSGKIFFIEFKDAKGTQKPDQKVIERILKSLGFRYYICRTVEHFKEIIYDETGERC
jgi:hypothetical protein